MGVKWSGKMTEWARMKFKPEKSRSLTIVKGKIVDQKFKISEKVIPTVNEQPVKCLGKVFDATLKDIRNAEDIDASFQRWLTSIDKSELQGKHKAWCFQFGVIPRLQWPFLLYDIALSRISKMEQTASKFLRKWFGLPPSTSSAAMYSNSSIFPKPLSSTVEEYKAAKVRAVSSLQLASDKKVIEASNSISSGRKWKPQLAVEDAISRKKHSDVVGTVCVGRMGLGNYGGTTWAAANPKTRRGIGVQQIREQEEESRQLHLRGLTKQGAWTRWESALDRQLSWNDVRQMEQGKLSFILRSVLDLLPSPANLRQWRLREDAICGICGNDNCTLQHILSS